ncbi:O-succinylhomoserine sulfhydrylase [Aestuariivirga litoralis]|uniref:O-succinylhomoserine sulfhydrylase n=1 Tax=Aestuariivirga litoralis TaxID=2650924 RepID=A0A2W2BTZ7_9HYPH|nr:O-succinylhomoserine sulfhydrylase [Aestuariivirga litoralis]PZF76946.1 O-succinylhomoserine sulfhydrylase [Aestuariivirga litoralis]
MKKHKSDPKSWGDATKLVRGGLHRTEHGETSEALFLNSGFVYDEPETAERRFAGEDDGYVYGRYGNPTVSMFEDRLALLEGAEACYALASGMSAVFGALACQLKAGDHLVASKALFGSCYQIVTAILPRFGIRTTLVDGKDLAAWKEAITSETKCVFLETPSNPTLETIDLEAVCAIAKAKGANVVVDNIFATPILQRPLNYGADVIVYSGTKHMDGQGRVLGGAIMSTKTFKEELLKPFLRHTGPSISPFNAWVLLKGLETLKLRVEAQSHSARKVAEALEGMKGVARVLYPHLDSHPQVALCRKQMKLGGTMVTFEVEGGKQKAFDLLRHLGIIDISNNLGDAKSLMTHPASTTHRNIGAEARAMMGITDGMVRLSVGLEDTDDLIGDLRQALAA